MPLQVPRSNSSSPYASAAHPDFNTLDTTKKGALTADEVKGDSWLSTNFSRRDLNHDGTLSRQEYAACK
jgi:EF hand